MSKRVISILMVIILVGLMPGFTNLSGSNKSLPRFVLSATSLCQSAFISWEKVPDALTYILKRDNIEIAKLSSKVNYYIDHAETLTEGSLHFYKVITENSEEIPIAESVSASITNVCFREDDCYTKLEYTIDSYMYRVDGTMKGPMDAPPQIVDGRTFLVIRYVTESIGASIDWDGVERKITITTTSGKIIELWLGESTARIDGKETEIDPANSEIVPVIDSGRTLLPLRFVGEHLGAKGDNGIIWHADTKTVEMNIFDETCVPPFEWRLNVVSVNRAMGTMVCKDNLGIEFDLIMDVSFPSEIVENSRVTVFGPINQTSLGERPKITCKGISLIATPDPDKTEMIICKIVSVECSDKGTATTIQLPGGEEREVKVDGKTLCGVAVDTWIKMQINNEGIATDWEFVIDEIIKDESEEFGPILMKILEVDFEQGIIRCNKPDEYYKDWRNAIELSFRFLDPELVTDVEEHRCYNIYYSRNHMGKEFLAKVEQIPCPAQFEIEFTKVPEVVSSGVGNKIKVKITNHNEFPRIYKPIFRSENFDGYFKPDRESIEIYPEESDLFSMNFASDIELDGIIEFEVGVECDGVEIVETFEILFRKPEIELEKISTSLKAVIGEVTRFKLKITNRGSSKMKVDTILFAPEFPGEIGIVEGYIFLRPGETDSVTIVVTPNSELEAGTETSFEYGIKLKDYEKRERVGIQFISGEFPVIIYDEHTITNKLCTIKGRVDWKGLKPGKIEVFWDDSDEWEEVEGFPLKHQFEFAGDFLTIIHAEAETGEGYLFAFYFIDIPGKKPVIHVTDIVFSRSTLRGIIVEGFTDWKGLKKDTTTFYWSDDTDPSVGDFPMEHNYTNNDWIQTVTICSIAESGPKTYDGWILFWLRFLNKSIPIKIQDIEYDENTKQKLQMSMLKERLSNHEAISYNNYCIFNPDNVHVTKYDSSRRTGGKHIK